MAAEVTQAERDRAEALLVSLDSMCYIPGCLMDVERVIAFARRREAEALLRAAERLHVVDTNAKLALGRMARELEAT